LRMDRIKAHRIFSVFIVIRVAFEKRLARSYSLKAYSLST